MDMRWLTLSGALFVASVSAVSGDDWPGFRGLERQGVGAAQQSPVHWSSTRNIQWKTRVRGSGHSSPVIAGPHVFVTTAYEADAAKRLTGVARGVRLALCLAAIAFWLVLPAGVPRWQTWCAGALVALFLLLALVDERVFSFARSPARAWLGAAPAAIIGLFISVYGLERSAALRRAIGIALALLGVLLVARMPGGFDQTRPLLIGLAIVTMAAFIGSALVLFGVFAPGGLGAPWARERGRIGPDRPEGRALRSTAPVWRTIVIAGAVVGFLIPSVLMPRAGWVHAIACLDRADGRVLWVREGLWGPRTAVHRVNSQATPTAVTDGRRVFAYFGGPGLMAVSASGDLLWTNSDVPFETIYGVGASPVLAHDTLVISSFTPKGPYLVAFDTKTGREMWRTSRVSVHPDFGDSRTPLVVTVNGHPTVIVWGIEELTGHDLATGKVSWHYAHGANGRMGSMVTSMISRGDMLYLPLENGMIALSLARLAAKQDPVVWTSTSGGSGPATPVLYEDRIFAVSAAGIASCVDALTGAPLWRARLAGDYYSSPVAVAGKVYFTNESGTTTVVAARSNYQMLAENQVGEPVVATIAPVDDHLYLRSHNHLYRIGP
jgi:outer membrane protein assembly factor BamB